MKKVLLPVLLAAATVLTATADVWVPLNRTAARQQLSGTHPVLTAAPGNVAAMPATVPSRAELSMLYGDAYDMYTALGFREATNTTSCAILMTAETQAQFAGNTITAIRFGHGPMEAKSFSDVTVYITDDLFGDDIASASAPLKSNATAYQEIELAEPYEIKAGGDDLYIGWRIRITEGKSGGCFPIGVDYIYHTKGSCDFAGYKVKESDDWMWDNIGENYGDVCVWARVSGDNLPTNQAEIYGLGLPGHIEPGKTATVEVGITNIAANDITTLTLESNAEGVAATHNVTVDPTAYKQDAVVSFELTPTTAAAMYPVTVRIVAVNGEPYASKDVTGTTLCMDADKTYQRTVLFEEATGTWCGWCVRGIVGIKELKAKYDKDGHLAVLAIHKDNDFPIPTYDGWIDKYVSGYPYCAVDRAIEIDPNAEALEKAYLTEVARPSYSTVAVEATLNAEKTELTMDADVTFGFDLTGRDYDMVFAVAEDHVGPASQTNAYSGGGAGAMGGWENKSSSVRMYYNEVVVVSTDAEGMDEYPFPGSISAGTPYSVTAVLDATKIKDPDKCTFVAFVINTRTGEVVNAAATTSYTAGVEAVNADSSDAPAELFNLQGVRVNAADAAPGLYIERRGNAVTKIVK